MIDSFIFHRQEKKTRVRFSEPEIRVVTAPLGETWLLWYSHEDFTAFEREDRLMVRSIRKGNIPFTCTEEACLRGLEHKLSIRAQIEKETNRVTVIQSVLDEQRRQRELGQKDPSRIQSESFKASKKAKECALERARLDALAIFIPPAMTPLPV
jgi:hypothetical protein